MNVHSSKARMPGEWHVIIRIEPGHVFELAAA
jgi:hypothetical protein